MVASLIACPDRISKLPTRDPTNTLTDMPITHLTNERKAFLFERLGPEGATFYIQSFEEAANIVEQAESQLQAANARISQLEATGSVSLSDVANTLSNSLTRALSHITTATTRTSHDRGLW